MSRLSGGTNTSRYRVTTVIELIKYLSLIMMLTCIYTIQETSTALLTAGGAFLIYVLCVVDEYKRGVEHDRKMGR